MITATRLVWDAAGQPAPAAATVANLITDTPGQCAMCGETSVRTADLDKSLGANFSDRSIFRWPGGRICPGCLWCCSGKPPATLRMWSVVAAPGHPLPDSAPKAWLHTPGLLLHNRSAGRIFGDLLATPPAGLWVCSIALSAQKHVLPYAPVNHGPGEWRVRVEDHTVTSHPDQWRHIRLHATMLRSMGIPESAVLTGEPAGIKDRTRLAEWAGRNRHLSPWLNSPLLRLALWTITKEQLHVTR